MGEVEPQSHESDDVNRQSPPLAESHAKEVSAGSRGNHLAATGSVDYLVAGDKMGPAKLKKAEKLGVRIISEEEFIAMIEGGGPVEKAAQQELF